METFRSGNTTVKITYVVKKMYAEGALYSATIVVTGGGGISQVIEVE